MRTGIWVFGWVLPALCLLGGCGGPPNEPLWEQIGGLNKEHNEQGLRIKELEAQNRQLREENQTLLAVKDTAHLAALDRLDRIAIRDRSGLYDKDGNGTPETLIVYLETIDDRQDRIKTPGRVQVELWDLGRPAAKARLGQWNISPEELKNLWAATLMTNYYRLSFPVAPALTQGATDLTLKVRFTDTLTGQVKDTQTVIPGPA